MRTYFTLSKSYFTIYSLDHRWREGNLCQSLVPIFVVYFSYTVTIIGTEEQDLVHEGMS